MKFNDISEDMIYVIGMIRVSVTLIVRMGVIFEWDM